MKGLGVVLSFVLFITMITKAFAASATGAIGNRTTSASLTRATLSASGYTTSSPSDGNATNYIWVNLTYYYTNGSGHAVRTTKHGENTSHYTAASVVVGSGTDVQSISASSFHQVSYSESYWSTYLYA